MAKYKTTDAEAGQNYFLTVNLSQQLLPGTFEWTVDRLIETDIDTSVFDVGYKNDRSGRPAIHPAALLKLILFGYSRGILTSRKIENLADTNIIAKALTKDQAPDHSTIAAFVSEHTEQIKKIFTQVLLVCYKNGLIKGDMFALDGCRLPSNAGKRWSGTHKKLRNKQERIEKRVEALIEQHKNNDAEKNADDYEREKKAIERLQHDSEYIKQFLETAKPRMGASGKEVQSNVTDNESAKIKGPHGIIQGYNGLAIADSENQIIVSAEARGVDYEGGEYPDMLDTLQNTMKEISGKEKPLDAALVLSDTNYFSEDNLQAAKDRGIDVIIPDPHFRKRDSLFDGRPFHETKDEEAARAQSSYTIDDFKYEETDNSYICPRGIKLEYRGKSALRHHRVARRWSAKTGACSGCPFIDKCIKLRKNGRGKEPHKTLYLTEDRKEWLSEQMRKKIDTVEFKKRYSHRAEIIEPCFANIEYCKGMTRFYYRGRAKVDAQWKLYAMVHNIEKCIGIYANKYAV